MASNLVQSYSRTMQILQQVTAELEQNQPMVIYQPSLVTPWDRTASLRYYGFVSDLRVNIDINSLPESGIPNLEVGSSRTERITAVKNLEWASPRFELDLLMRTSRSPGWLPVASLSLLNRRPYYIVNLLNYLTDQVVFQIANDGVLGVRIRDVGHGILQGNDRLTIFGAVKEEVSVIPSESQEITLSQDYTVDVGTQSVQILAANANRKQAVIVNSSATSKVYVSYAPISQVGRGILLYPNGGSYEINLGQNLFRGAIAAIADTGTATLSILEGV